MSQSFLNRRGWCLVFWCLSWLARSTGLKNITYGVASHLGSIGFPEGSAAGIFFALGVPVDIPNKSVLFSLYFEGNYGLPGEANSTEYAEEVLYRKKRRIDRRLLYEILIRKLESFGFSGQSCLLKMICEAAKHPLTYNGMLGDVLQIVLTPSSSEDENLPEDIVRAEYADNCHGTYVECPESPLEMISDYVPNHNSPHSFFV